MPVRKRIHWVFLGDLEEHSTREVLCGAADYTATRPGVSLDPCPVVSGRGARPMLSYVERADGLLFGEIDLRLVGGEGARWRQPHVFYLANAPHRQAPAVTLDEGNVGRMAAEHLIHRGYRDLAFFGYPEMPWANQRGEGFRAAAAARGLTVQTCNVLPSAMHVYRSPWLQSRPDKLHSALRSLPTPCGIFVAHDVGACYVIQAAHELGLRIPEQLGVVGVDDDPIANAAAGLAISTVQVPFREVGWQAAALLYDWMQGKRTSSPPPLLPVRVNVRTSTNAFMVADPLVRRAQELIEPRRAEGLTVDELVRVLHTTPATLGQRFREHLKMTPAKYILHRRIEYAKELLRAGKLNVEQVSEACHFHDCSYFCQTFKRATGVSPGALRPAR